ncbi:hypothetical protein [Microcoleus sp. S13_B4]|uniref:hypothetical protein n=1 Tax=Microcoleus sp. S13_B4 TaxID=3055408 RepID=UPI002FD153B0
MSLQELIDVLGYGNGIAVSSIALLSIVISDRAMNLFGVRKRHCRVLNRPVVDRYI